LRPISRLRGFRVAQLTVALTPLVLPASAFAFAGSTGADTPKPASLPVHVFPHHLRLGRAVTVSGRAADRGGEQVELQSAARDGRRWSALSITRIGARGRYAFHVRLRHSRMLRAVEVARGAVTTAHADGAAALAAAPRRTTAVSRVAPVLVSARVRVADRERTSVGGRGAEVAGQLLPGRGGRSVILEGLVARHWRALGRARTGRRGGFAVRAAAGGPARQPLRVVFAGDRANARATGGAGILNRYEPVVASWYDDAGSTACGFHATDGVANRTLPCGTKVRFARGGRSVTATVDDRGPYVYGRDYDLNQNTAAALGFAGVGTVEASVQ
jgi:rare lipoprotein A